jgi:hypothetical protein
MTIIRVKGFKIFRDRHGHLRCYHRETGIAIDLKKMPLGSAGFIAECAKIAALADTQAAKEKPGTLGSLICDYRKSTSRARVRIGRTWLCLRAAPRRHALIGPH